VRAFCLTAWLLAAAPAGAAQPSPPPRIVVLLVVDQLPVRLYDRILHVAPPGGLRRLAEGGANLTGRYGHANTSTAPGHALIATGADAGRSGIVGNSWWSREAWRKMYAAEDAGFSVLGRPPASHDGTSPRNLRLPGLGDVLRAASYGRARIVSMSWKDRCAILLGGQRPSAALWFDIPLGGFVTSTYYAQTLPAWVARANAARPAQRMLGRAWTPLLGLRELALLGGPDDAPGEGDYEGMGVAFPHPVRSLRALGASPLANQLLAALAEDALIGEGMGTDAVPDLLAVSFSAGDFVGHVFGPDSREATDLLAQLDRLIAHLLSTLDRRVGAGRYTVVLTSDHGCAPLPEQAATARLLPGVQAPVRMPPDAQIAALVAQAVGTGWRTAFEHPHLYLDAPAGGGRARLGEALSIARKTLLALPGVERVLGPGELAHPADDIARAVRASWDPERAGDLYVVLTPGSVYEEEMVVGKGTGHGSPRIFDQEVPLVLYGARVRPAARPAEPVAEEALAATLAALMDVPPPPGAERPALEQVLAR